MVARKFYRPTGDYSHLSKSERKKAIDKEYAKLIKEEQRKRNEKIQN